MFDKITIPLVVAVACLIASTILFLWDNYPAATYQLGLAIFYMVCHIGIRLEGRSD